MFIRHVVNGVFLIRKFSKGVAILVCCIKNSRVFLVNSKTLQVLLGMTIHGLQMWMYLKKRATVVNGQFVRTLYHKWNIYPLLSSTLYD